MVKTVVNLTLPFALLDEGDYEVSMNGEIVKISIKLERTVSRMGQIQGVEFNAPGASTVRMENDFHGIVNISRIQIEFPHYILPTKMEQQANGSQKDVSGDHHVNVQKESILSLNRLIEVVRWHTRRYWIPNLSGSDIYLNKFDLFDDEGQNTGGQFHMQPIVTLFQIPNLAVSQSDIQPQITQSLKNEEKIPVHDSLYLDSLDDFSKGKFNKAVMTINTALESVTTDYLLDQLIAKGEPKDEAKKKIDKIIAFGKKKSGKSGFHKVLSVDFKEITGRSLEDETELWAEFNDSRLKRKTTLHPHVGKLSEEKARKTIISVSKIMNWVLKQDRYSTFEV